MSRTLSMQLAVVVASLLVSFTSVGAVEITAPWAPTLRWDYDRTSSGFHADEHDNCVDFNWVDGNDERSPILVTQNGRVETAGWSSSYGWHVWIVGNNGSKNIFAHLYSEPVIKKGELVEVGQVVGFCGCTPGGQYCTGPHLHYGHYIKDANQVFQSQLITSIDGQTVIQGSNATSKNIAPLEREFNAIGASNYGTLINRDNTYQGVRWFFPYNPATLYRSQNFAANCYIQEWHNGVWNESAIVYDALGGARKAYTVRTGFLTDPQGWRNRGGPNSDLGMPITNEYAYEGGARQDFQGGYLKYVSGQGVSVHYLPNMPGWAWGNWDNTFSYLFALAYERNGSRTRTFLLPVHNPTLTLFPYVLS